MLFVGGHRLESENYSSKPATKAGAPIELDTSSNKSHACEQKVT